MRIAAFNHLINIQKGLSKVMDIKYDKLAAQNYLSSPTFSNTDVSLLAAVRSHTLRGIRCNFKNMYQDTNCPLECWEPNSLPYKDTQEHLLSCAQLELDTNTIANTKISYSDIYGNVCKQKSIVSLFNQVTVCASLYICK